MDDGAAARDLRGPHARDDGVPGRAVAALAGVPAALGYLLFCGGGAAAIASAPGRGGSWREEAAGVGVVQAMALGLGFLFVSLYGGVLGDLESLLFGDVLGVSDGQVVLLAVVALAVLGVLAAIGRPLLFASIDPPLASTRGVPVRGLTLSFLALLAVAVASASQVTGPLLVLALLVMPAAGARVLSARPAVSLALTLVIALLAVWVGLGIAYFSAYPPSMFIAAVAFACYLLARVAALLGRGRSRRRLPRPPARSGWGPRLMLGQEYMRNALLAGGFIALACGVCGWFVVLRGQLFAGDALSHVAFPGALAAAAAGIDERIGLFAATIAAGIAIALLGRGALAARGARASGAAPADDADIGVLFTVVLALGVFFLTRFSLGSGGSAGIQAARTLFGSIFGLGGGEAALAAILAVAAWRVGGDRAAAPVRLGRPGAGRRARRADAPALGRLHGASRRGGRGGDAGGRGAAAARPARGPAGAAQRLRAGTGPAPLWLPGSRSWRCGAGSCSPTGALAAPEHRSDRAVHARLRGARAAGAGLRGVGRRSRPGARPALRAGLGALGGAHT